MKRSGFVAKLLTFSLGLAPLLYFVTPAQAVVKFSEISPAVKASANSLAPKQLVLTQHSAHVVSNSASLQPSAPILSVSGHSDNSIGLIWDAPSNSGSSPIVNYLVEFSSDNSNWNVFSHPSSPGLGTTVTQLSKGSQYYFRVSAINASGPGAISNITSEYTSAAPGMVTGATASLVNGNSAFLNWSAPANNGDTISDYVIQYSSDLQNWITYSDGINAQRSATVNNLLLGNHYSFRIAAVNRDGQGSWPNGVQNIGAGNGNACAVMANATIRCWGYTDGIYIGSNIAAGNGTPTLQNIFGARTLSMSYGTTCVTLIDTSLACIGSNLNYEYGIGLKGNSSSYSPTNAAQTPGNFLSVSGNGFQSFGSHYCGINKGQVYCWGNNSHSESGNIIYPGLASTPTLIAGISNAIQVSTGSDFSCALTSIGSIFCWGNNGYGQLGTGTLISSASPVAVIGISNAIRISSGFSSSCAVLADYTVKCWGQNPAVMPGMKNVKDVSVGPPSGPYALTQDGQVIGLGGQPSDMLSLASSKGGYGGTCGLTFAGGVYCWGDNTYGFVGNGRGLINGTVISSISTPTQVSGLGSVYPFVYVISAPDIGLETITSHTQSSITLQVSPPISNGGSQVSRYSIRYSKLGTGNWSTTGPIEVSNLNTTISGIDSGSIYEFQVAFSNYAGFGSWSTSITEYPSGIPNPPRLLLTDVTSNSIVATSYGQANNGDTLKDFRLQYSVDGSTWIDLAIDIDSTSARSVVTNLVAGRLYYFRASALNRDGMGPYTYTQIKAVDPLIPQFGVTLRTSNGFDTQILNYDPNYTWTCVVNLPLTAAIDSLGILHVSGLNPEETKTVTVKSGRTNYPEGSAQTSGSALKAALYPTFSPTTSTSDGFFFQITNYDGLFSWTASSSIAATISIDSTGLVTVSGLPAGTSLTVFVTSSRSGYASSSPYGGGISGASIALTALTPSFGEITQSPTGFTIQITNYDSNFAWTVVSSAGGRTYIDANGLLTVSGIGPLITSSVTVMTSRLHYTSGNAVSPLVSTLIGDPYSIRLDSAIPMAGGFDLPIANFSYDYTWNVVTSSGGAFITQNVIHVGGLQPGETCTVTVSASRQNYTTGVITTPPIASLTGIGNHPLLSSPSFFGNTIQWSVTNTDPTLRYTASTQRWVSGYTVPGTIINLKSGVQVISMSPVIPGKQYGILITTYDIQNHSYQTSAVATTPNAGLIPNFGDGSPTTDGFTIQISNYDAGFTWRGVNNVGGLVSISSNGLVSVTGLGPNVMSTVTITSSRSGYYSGTETSTPFSSLMGSPLIPIFGTSTSTRDGFTLQINNFDSRFSWQATNSVGGRATVNSLGVVVVSGISPGTLSSVTINTARTNYQDGSATSPLISSTFAEGLTPNFGERRSTTNGFTVPIINFDSLHYSWNVFADTGVANLNQNTGLLTVTGVQPGETSTVLVTTSRQGYLDGSARISGSPINGTALNPTFSTVRPGPDGFAVTVTNFDSRFSWTLSVTGDGNAVINVSTGVITVSGLSAGATSVLTIVTARRGYASGGGTISGTAMNGAALNPSFSTVRPSSDGFAVTVTNFDAQFSWILSATNGGTAVVNNSTGVITVSGLAAGATSVITIVTSRRGYASGSGTISGSAMNGAALNPTFTTPVSTANGFTATITNYDSRFRWTISTTSGSVALNASTGALTITGIAPGAMDTITVLTSRTGYASGSGTLAAAAMNGAALNPSFSAVRSAAAGFTVTITNFDSHFTWTLTPSSGSAALNSSTGVITLTGLNAGDTATISVSTSRIGYQSGSGSITGSALNGAALNPTFSNIRPTADGFTTSISNFSNSYRWTLSPTVGSAALNTSTGVITVTGVNPGGAVSVLVATTRTGYANGSATVSATAMNGAALIPTYSNIQQTVAGFTATISNYSNSYRWTVSATAGATAVINSSTGVLTVTGLAPGVSSTVTLTTARTGYAIGSSTVTSSAQNGAALNATFNTPTAKANGFAVTITNFNNAFKWTLSSTKGGAALNTSTGVITVSGLNPGESTTVSIVVTRSGYASGSGSITGTALNGAALIPTFSTARSTANGFTVTIANYDNKFSWAIASTTGTITGLNSSTGVITITSLQPGETTTLDVSTSRTGYASGHSTFVGGASKGVALIASVSAPIESATSFTIIITNYDPAFTYNFSVLPQGTVTPGSASGSNLPLSITGLAAGTAKNTTLTIRTSRTGYESGSKTVSG